MDIAASELSPDRIYKLLVSTVMPRPIALVSTLNADGGLNAAPFSFFNVFSNAPPLLVIGIEGNKRADGQPHKDTARNIAARGEFVVNLVSHAMAVPMVACAIDFPAGVSEFDQAGFTPRASKQVAVPGIAESPVSFECRLFNTVSLPFNRSLVTGEIVHLHVADSAIDDKLHVDPDALDLIGRMHGAGWYTRTRDRFEVPRMTPAEWQARNEQARR
jgi:flavin reductase (DIM6/NTAB) family NADH-FMN oxidoreductase RutF